MKKSFFLLLLISFQFALLAQDWNLKTQGDSVLVQQGQKWIPVTSNGITENLLKQTENLVTAKDELTAAQAKVTNLQKRIANFKELKAAIEQRETDIRKSKLTAASPPSQKSKKKKKGK